MQLIMKNFRLNNITRECWQCAHGLSLITASTNQFLYICTSAVLHMSR